MKTFIRILLVGFLGFLGCSGSNDGTNDTTRTVGQAIPVEPFGIEDVMTPTFGWTPVQEATKYHLLVQEAIQNSSTQDTNETYIIDEWYTAEEAGCTSEENLCMVTPDIDIDGTYTWKILACAGDECGLWSDEQQFSYPPPTTPRFTDNGDDTVTDTHTGLMWTKDANLYGTENWWNATSYCWDLTQANHSDWSLPYFSELNTLIDETQVDPALPPDNPFTNVQSDFYWSSTTESYQTNYAWGVHLGDGSVGYGDKSNDNDVWCVRGEGRAAPDPYDGGCPDGSCQETNQDWTVFMFKSLSLRVPVEHFGFNFRSYAHSCKDWKKSVSSDGHRLKVNTGSCKSERSNVLWIKNEVIGKGFTPIMWDSRYMVAQYEQEGSVNFTPGNLYFAIYGDFNPVVSGISYTCPNVMIAVEQRVIRGIWPGTDYKYRLWWFLTNTTLDKCSIRKRQVTVSCNEVATHRPALLTVSATKAANAFDVNICE